MKEFLKSAFDKWFVTIMTGGIMLLGTAVWDYFKNYYDMPYRMDRWEQRSKVDSLYYTRIIHRNDSLDKLQTDYILYLEDILQKNGIK